VKRKGRWEHQRPKSLIILVAGACNAFQLMLTARLD
jgi:hypothetical protein